MNIRIFSLEIYLLEVLFSVEGIYVVRDGIMELLAYVITLLLSLTLADITPIMREC